MRRGQAVERRYCRELGKESDPLRRGVFSLFLLVVIRKSDEPWDSIQSTEATWFLGCLGFFLFGVLGVFFLFIWMFFIFLVERPLPRSVFCVFSCPLENPCCCRSVISPSLAGSLVWLLHPLYLILLIYRSNTFFFFIFTLKICMDQSYWPSHTSTNFN